MNREMTYFRRHRSPSVPGFYRGTGGIFCQRAEPLLLILLVGLIFTIYSNTLNSPFVFDDKENIERNPRVHMLRIDRESLARAATGLNSNRPVSNLSFAFNYRLHGDDVFGYHLVNLVIHCLNGLFLYRLIKKTLQLSGTDPASGRIDSVATSPLGPTIIGSESIRIAFLTALMWSLHPIQTQSVTYIVQRMNSLATLFYLLSFLFYIDARLAGSRVKTVAGFIGCAAAGLMSLGSKEIAATLPVFLFLYEWYFFQDLRAGWILKMRVPLFLIGLFLTAALFLFVGKNPLTDILGGYPARGLTPVERLMTEARVVVFYVSQLLYPHPSRLNLDHDFPLSHTPFDPVTTLPAIVAVAACLVLAVVLARKYRLVSFSILWFFGNLAIESSIIPLEIIFEHRNYLPSMFFFLLPVWAVCRFVNPKWLGTVALWLMILTGAFWSYERNHVWRDEVTLLRDCVEKSPQKARPNYGLGRALAARGDLDESMTYLRRTLDIDPRHVEARNSLGSVLAREGKPEAAMAEFRKVLEIDPNYPGAFYNLGRVYASRGNEKAAADAFRRALAIYPDMPQFLYSLSWLLSTGQDPSVRNGAEAVSLARRLAAVKRNPDPLVLDTLAAAHAENGHFDDAVRSAERALAMATEFGMAEFASRIGEHLASYRSGRPFRQER